MANWNKLLWGGLGWALGGPIGGIIGVVIGAVVDEASEEKVAGKSIETRPGDFGAALLVLCAAVMKSDNRLLKSELDFVKAFFIKQFGEDQAKERMLLFREILKQEYSLQEVCYQIRHNLDYPSRLQLIHLLFGLAYSDNELHPDEINIIENIANFLAIERKDHESIKAMFVKDTTSAYKILEIDPNVTDEDVKKAYRLMAIKYHPDKVHHLGPEFQKDAHEKFKTINAAYEQIKKERNIK
jgi:DnaJ like chaperone protein